MNDGSMEVLSRDNNLNKAPTSPKLCSPKLLNNNNKKKVLTKQMSLCVENVGPRNLKSSLTVPSTSFDFDIPTLTLTLNPLENDEVTIDMSGTEEEASVERDRASSIGSASSLIGANGGGDSHDVGSHCVEEESHFTSLLPSAHDLGIRRVSEISHINQLRREVSGLDHLASEFYEISRQPNPDSISLDSIHKQVLQRCQNKYIPPAKSSTGNKVFVILTGACTVLGIVYGFWYKNFGKYSHHSA